MLQKKIFTTCIPLVSHTEKELWIEIESAIEQKPDYLEWRRDYFLEENIEMEEKILKKTKQYLGEVGLIYTFRNSNEGGFREVSESERLKFIALCVTSGIADYIDIELKSSDLFLEKIRDLLKGSSTALLLSHHDFHKTYSIEKIVEIFKKMDEKGADVLKLAMYAETEKDLKKEIEAVCTYGLKTDKPIIAISMGRLGTISRVIPDFIGGSLTYAAGKGNTAPGQMTIEEIYQFRKKLGVSIGK